MNMNPIQMFQAMKNPQQIINQIMNNSQAMQNPIIKSAIQMYRNGDADGLNKMAENLAKEKNTTVDEVKNSIMQRFGMN